MYLYVSEKYVLQSGLYKYIFVPQNNMETKDKE